MASRKCVSQNIYKYIMGSLVLAAALGLLVISVTLLPFFGFIMALPVAALAVIIFRLNFNDRCEIDFSAS